MKKNHQIGQKRKKDSSPSYSEEYIEWYRGKMKATDEIVGVVSAKFLSSTRHSAQVPPHIAFALFVQANIPKPKSAI
jgi:hypothetical protein